MKIESRDDLIIIVTDNGILSAKVCKGYYVEHDNNAYAIIKSDINEDMIFEYYTGMLIKITNGMISAKRWIKQLSTQDLGDGTTVADIVRAMKYTQTSKENRRLIKNKRISLSMKKVWERKKANDNG